MNDWQPIETAPRDGTTILLTDGERFAGGQLSFYIQAAMIYKHGSGGMIQNPQAGERVEWWQLFGCSAFSLEADTQDWDGQLYFEPTHWTPLPEPPQAGKLLGCLETNSPERL